MRWITSAWQFRQVSPIHLPSGACLLIDREAPGRAQYELDLTMEEETTGKMGLTEFLVNGLRIQDAQYVSFKPANTEANTIDSVGYR